MSGLIGYQDVVRKIVARIEGDLLTNYAESVNPHSCFSLRGERRSGRSGVFSEVASTINATEGSLAHCFVGELSEATGPGFERALLDSLATSTGYSGDYASRFNGKLVTPTGFIKFADELLLDGGKPPVFLIDMGAALEEAWFKKRGGWFRRGRRFRASTQTHPQQHRLRFT